MDSFFKAAVCDLDKLLDDFELNTEELDCRNVFLKPSVFPFSSLPPQAPPPEPSPVPPNLPDLNQLRYGSSPSCPDASSSQEVKGQPLTTVDLLSSVDRGPTASSAPPCPDRALKPVCDLVSDTGSAVLARANGHDAFSELDLVEEQMAAEEEEEEVKEEEALLVDFDSPVVAATGDASDTPQAGEYSASLSLLDVILPAAVERSADSADREDVLVDPSDHSEPQGPASETASESQETSGTGEADSPGDAVAPADGEAVGLSCLPLAVSMCGALVNAKTSGDDPGPAAEPESGNAEDVGEDGSRSEEPADSAVSAEGGASPQQLPEPAAADFSSGENPEPSPMDPPEFGFEYLPESDQAELLVTDEELDAFLQAQAESEQDGGGGGGGGGGCFCSISAGLPQPESLQESDLEHSASAEDDRTTCSSADAPQIPRHQEIEASAAAGHAPSSISSDQQQPSYGGARPKQLHCQTSRPAPAGREEEEEEEDEEEEEEEPPAADPAPQENQDYSVGYNELSEPPPYPGEPPSDGGGDSAAWRQGGGAEEPGSTEPVWVPDADAPNCMSCQQRFTFTKRRHHCRACGKVYCAVCCSRKCKLKYLEKEARVCNVCFDTIHRAQALERMMSPTGPSPNPNVPSEYCSTIPPLQQARAAGTLNSPPPTVMVPVSVLKHPSNDGCPREQKRVWFADGILPNGEVADTTKLSVTSRRSSQDFAGVAPDQSTPDPAAAGVSTSSSPPSSSSSSSEPPGGVDVVRPPVSGPWDYALLSGIGSLVQRVPSLLPDSEDQLPPLLITTGEDEAGDVLVEESPAPCQILHLLEEGGPRPLSFVLNANLLVNVKLVTYGGRQCWCFGSNGLQALGQRELVFVLESLPEEKTLPRDLFTLYLNVYQDAQRGKLVEELDNVTFTSSFLGSKDHGGMLFFSPSCQPLDGLALPPRPFLFGILIQKLEVPWAKVFPLRLLLRLGAESSVYPTPLVSVRFRDSVYRETGHTIMNLLADLRNYQYSLSVVEGLRIHMEMGHSYIDIPKSSFTEVQKLLNSSNEHVISVGACFSSEADSHLVCFQNEDGNYQTQASSMPGKTRTVTGASFVVFNGALKASSGFIAKSSIVEDGLMVQIPPETMESLRNALRDQTDFHIACGRSDGVEVRENVSVRWVDWSSPVNAGKTSGVDGRPLDGVHSVKVQQDVDSESDGRCIRCTEVFYQLRAPDCSLQSVLSSCGVFQREMASATCSALMPHLAVLAASAINSVSLRISTQADMVEYQAGCGGRLLPQRYMNELDGALIPVIHGGGASVPQTAMDMEFTFYITHAI